MFTTVAKLVLSSIYPSPGYKKVFYKGFALYFYIAIKILIIEFFLYIFFVCFNFSKTRFTGVDPGFLESGFIRIKWLGFTLLLLSNFSQISHENEIIWSH